MRDSTQYQLPFSFHLLQSRWNIGRFRHSNQFFNLLSGGYHSLFIVRPTRWIVGLPAIQGGTELQHLGFGSFQRSRLDGLDEPC
jgi:hypothetical protein